MSDDFEDFTVDEAAAAMQAEIDLDNRQAAAEIDAVWVVNWRELDNETAHDVWVDLREWVEWITLRYQVSPPSSPTAGGSTDGSSKNSPRSAAPTEPSSTPATPAWVRSGGTSATLSPLSASGKRPRAQDAPTGTRKPVLFVTGRPRPMRPNGMFGSPAPTADGTSRSPAAHADREGRERRLLHIEGRDISLGLGVTKGDVR